MSGLNYRHLHLICCATASHAQHPTMVEMKNVAATSRTVPYHPLEQTCCGDNSLLNGTNEEEC